MKHTILFFILPALSLLFFSCSQEAQQSFQPVPSAFGNPNQIVVIADERIWEGPVGDTLRYYFSAPFLILPQPEPIYDLKFFTPVELAKEISRRELRHYFIVGNLNETDSPTSQLIYEDIGIEKARKSKEDSRYTTTIGKDKWAKGQQVIYQFAYSDDELINGIRKNFPLIDQKIKASDKERIQATVYQAGENNSVQDEIAENIGVSIKVPGEYFVAFQNDELFWLRKETDDISSNILIKKIDYTNDKQLTKENLKAIRDTLGRKYVSSEIENTYMKINDFDLPTITTTKSVNGNYTIESRGIWEIVNDYMGGPYLSYLIHNKETNTLLYLDGFVYAPGKDKRNFMQHLELILSTASVTSSN